MASSTAELAAAFIDADDAWLQRLLTERPDLTHPVPTSLTTLAGRAASRASVGRALAHLTRPELAALELTVVLTESGATLTAESVSAAMGFDASAALARLGDLALLLPGTVRPAPGTAEAIGPSPLGLGPTLRSVGVRADDGWPTTAPALRAVLADAPESAQALAQTLAAGPPVGTLGTAVPESAAWLLQHKVLHRLSATEVVLPRDIALAMRGSRAAGVVTLEPPTPPVPTRDQEAIDADAVSHAEAVLRAIDHVVASWAQEPPGILRGGGLAMRDLKTIAGELSVPMPRAALIVELAVMGGLIGQLTAPDGGVWAPTALARGWHEGSTAQRWAALTRTWVSSSRVPWLAGTRTERGALRSALDPDLHRSWAAPLRRRVLAAFEGWPPCSAPTVEDLHGTIAWHTPRSVPPLATIAAVVDEATTLGLLGAGALAATGAALLHRPDDVARALTGLLPVEVPDLIIQGDLTGIVPGRPTSELADLLAASADVDSRGAALAVRFTAASIARAFDAGWTAHRLLDRLGEASRSGVPQPLEYLINDAARRRRRVRVQPAHTVLMVDDEAAALALLGDPTLAGLGMRLIGDCTIAADASPIEVHEALRRSGADVQLQGPDGSSVTMGGTTIRPAQPVDMDGPPTEQPVDIADAVAAMRAGEQRAQSLMSGARQPTESESVELLRTAAVTGSMVHLTVAGNGGVSQERLVKPISVDGGRVRALDPAREAEITVATHRIVAVRPV